MTRVAMRDRVQIGQVWCKRSRRPPRICAVIVQIHRADRIIEMVTVGDHAARWCVLFGGLRRGWEQVS